MKIAALDQALTFARTSGKLIAVRAIANGRVTGTDITSLATTGEDPISLVNRQGYDSVRTQIEAIVATTEVADADLIMPVDLTDAHIAVGTNYREHAKESAVEGDPLLFPKLVTPTSWRAKVQAGAALLDFEVELCLVTMKPLGLNEPATGGLILGNDFTDRATLLRKVDTSNPQSGRGFTSGKSAPGFLPVGNLFVVPRDLKAFVARLTLQLSVNGIERQRAPATDWIWDLDEILRQTRLKKDVTWEWTNGTARLPFTPDGAIPARTLIMAGTPAGTIWQGPGRQDFAFGALDMVLSAFTKPIVKCVIERYIARARRDAFYLKPGDRVTINVDNLGALENTVA